MNDFGEFPAELARLMAALQEESLNPAQRVRLAQLLREYPKAVQLYVHLTQLRVLLEEELGGGVPPVVPLMPPSIASHPGDGPAGRRAGGPFLANCRLDLGAGGRVAGVRPGRRRPADAVPARPARELTTTPLNLVSGLAEVLFKGGAVLVIEGPAEFTPETEDSVILKRGRLTARMPETARPFTVNTPAARVLDHGTEFGVDVGAGGTTVEVFHGRVSLKPGTAGDRGAEPVAVLAGTASRVGPSGRSTAPARPGSVAFIRQEEFEARLEERQRAPKSRWLAFR